MTLAGGEAACPRNNALNSDFKTLQNGSAAAAKRPRLLCPNERPALRPPPPKEGAPRDEGARGAADEGGGAAKPRAPGEEN